MWSRWIERASQIIPMDALRLLALLSQKKSTGTPYHMQKRRQMYVAQLYLNLVSEEKICIVGDICR